MKPINLEDTLERTAKIISHRSGVEVIFKGNTAPHTDGRTIYLPSLPSPCPEAILRVFRGTADHESAHVICSDFDFAREFKKSHGNQAFEIMNVLEDLRIESLMEQKFSGSKTNLRASYDDAMRHIESRVSCMSLWSRTLACMICEGKRMDSTLFGEDASQLVAMVEDLVVQAVHQPTTKDVGPLALEIMDRWKTAGKENPADEESPTREIFKEVSADDEQLSISRHLVDRIAEISRDNCSSAYRVYDRSQDVLEFAQVGNPSEYQRILDEVRPHVAGLRQRLVQTFKARSQCRYQPDPNGSKLDRKRLHTICLPLPSAPFRSKVMGVSDDVAVSLLVDLSGSMQGRRLQLAQQCSVLLAETMDKLGFPLEIIGATTVSDRRYLKHLRKDEGINISRIESEFTRCIPTQHIVFKSFAEPLRRCRSRFGSMTASHYTPLNESVLISGRRLLQQKASRRILIVLTDGACYLGCKSTQHIVQKNLLDNLEALGKSGIELIGVGIKSPYVLDTFQTAINIEALEELPTQFFKLISSNLLERK